MSNGGSDTRLFYQALLSRSLQKFANVFFWRSAWGAELNEEFVEVLAGELPFEGLSRSRPVVLKVQEALGDSVEVGKIIGRQDLPLDDREVDFDLVEPAGMNRSMHQRQAGVEIP